MQRFLRSLRVLFALLLASLALAGVAQAAPIERPAFRSVWERTAVPIQRGVANYSWIWGPEPFTPLLMEALAEGEGGRRAVQYFDKARMEVNDPNADPASPWYVTSGLLVSELVQGRVQTGLERFIPLGSANIPIAGDPDNTFPTYASLIRIWGVPTGQGLGQHITSVFLPEGANEFAQYANAPATEIVQLDQGFGIPRAFWEFMNRRGTIYQDGRLVNNQPVIDWRYVLGNPQTPAFWTRVRVGGVERDVMFQAFERRLLTYTPANPPAFQVEMGNVGQHYYRWRYEQPFSGGQAAVITVPQPDATVAAPLLVQGFGSGTAFEGAITVRLVNTTNGATLASQPTQVLQADVGKPGPFEATLIFVMPAGQTAAAIEVVTSSPRDGSEIMLARQQVIISAQAGASGAQARMHELVQRDLSRRLNLGPEQIRVLATEATQWPGSGLGCPAPERVYNPIILAGYKITLEAREQQYVYHTDQHDRFVLCQDGQPVLGLVSDEDSMVALLRQRGYTVELADENIEQPFLRGDGSLYRISGINLNEPATFQSYDYASAAIAADDAANLGPDGQPANAVVDWGTAPYFFRSGRVLLIYPGSNQTVVELLTELLGYPFAVPSPQTVS